MSTLRVELFYDEEASNGTAECRPCVSMAAGRTRGHAERECLSAIAFALEGDPREYDADAETITLDVCVAPAA